jgi:YD repeat-containing protein
VTYTFVDSSTRTVTLDAMGRPIESRDERGVRTQWTYTPSGQVKTVRRAV